MVAVWLRRWLGGLRSLPSPVIGYAILVLVMVGVVFRMEQIDNQQTSALRSLICLAQRNTLTSPVRTPAEKRRIIAFYKEALREVHAKPCPPLPQPKEP